MSRQSTCVLPTNVLDMNLRIFWSVGLRTPKMRVYLTIIGKMTSPNNNKGDFKML